MTMIFLNALYAEKCALGRGIYLVSEFIGHFAKNAGMPCHNLSVDHLLIGTQSATKYLGL